MASFRSSLRSTLDGFGGHGFALVDGAHFEALPALLRRERLFGRSLFLDSTDEDIQAAGPWLVMLSQEVSAIEKILSLVADKPAAVFWRCKAGEAVIYRHLRTLNMAKIPSWAADGNGAPPDGQGMSDEYKTVMFRHWDPRVFGAVLPTLHAGQFARVLGPGDEIAFFSDEFGGLRRVVADPSWPLPPEGLLTLHRDQIYHLNNRRMDVSNSAIANYLRKVAPVETGAKTDGELLKEITDYRQSARQWGLTHERSHGQWAYMMISTRDDFARTPGLQDYVRRGPSGPDENFSRLIDRLMLIAATDRAVT